MKQLEKLKAWLGRDKKRWLFAGYTCCVPFGVLTFLNVIPLAVWIVSIFIIWTAFALAYFYALTH